MKAIVIHEYGGPEVLKYEDFPDPVAGPGEVLVEVSAAGVNPIDALERAGLTKAFRPVHFPGVLGWDLSGTILRIGAGVESFSIGDRVFAWTYHTYAELCAVKASLLAKIPEGLDTADAAALPLATVTGDQLISVAGGVQRGQRVLVSGAFGSVGRSAVFAARERGATVIAGVRKKQQKGASTIGAHEILALDDEAALDALPAVDVVANTVRGRTAGQLLGKVKAGGLFASVTGAPEGASAYPTVRVVTYASKQDPQTMLRMAEAVGAGKLIIPIESRLPLALAREAHAALARGGAGKILLRP